MLGEAADAEEAAGVTTEVEVVVEVADVDKDAEAEQGEWVDDELDTSDEDDVEEELDTDDVSFEEQGDGEEDDPRLNPDMQATDETELRA